MRTGAVAALAASVFARRDAESYALMGLGHTAKATVSCLLPLLHGKRIRIKLLRWKD